jgi:molecular chaperone GrpE (heat shock protein)
MKSGSKSILSPTPNSFIPQALHALQAAEEKCLHLEAELQANKAQVVKAEAEAGDLREQLAAKINVAHDLDIKAKAGYVAEKAVNELEGELRSVASQLDTEKSLREGYETKILAHKRELEVRRDLLAKP